MKSLLLFIFAVFTLSATTLPPYGCSVGDATFYQGNGFQCTAKDTWTLYTFSNPPAGGGAAVPAAGMVKSDGTTLKPAVAGTDYVTPSGAAALAPVQKVAGRTGEVTLTHSDITDFSTAVPSVSPVKSVNGQMGNVSTLGGATVLTDAATINTNASLGDHFKVTLAGNRTLAAPTSPVDGQKITWEFIQDGTGSRTITLDPIFHFGTDVTGVTLTTTAGKRDFMGAIYDTATGFWYVVSFAKGY